MKRLVTQFDDTRTRATVATPTCCCCCCCCVASILTATAVTVMNAHELAGKTQLPEPERWLYRIGAVFVLPLAAILASAVSYALGTLADDVAWLVAVAVFLVLWAALLAGFYSALKLAARAKVIAITVGTGSVLFFVELYLAIAILFASETLWVYLVVAVGMACILVPLLRMWMHSGRGLTQS